MSSIFGRTRKDLQPIAEDLGRISEGSRKDLGRNSGRISEGTLEESWKKIVAQTYTGTEYSMNKF
jgi:hypothetical protein